MIDLHVYWSVVILFLALIYVYLTLTFDVFTKQGIKGPRPYPIFGNMLAFFQKPTSEVDVEYRRTYGKVYGLFTSRSPVLIVGEPDLVKEVLVNEFDCFVNRTSFGNLMVKPLDRMMTVLCDGHWRHVRSSLSPFFGSAQVKQMLPTVKGCVNNLIAHLDKHSGEGMNIQYVLYRYSMDVIVATAFGLDARSLDDPDNEFVKNASELFNFGNQRCPTKIMTLILMQAVPDAVVMLCKERLRLVNPEPVAYMEAVVKNALTNNRDSSEEGQNFIRLCLHQLVDIKRLSSEDIRYAWRGGYWTTKGLTEDDIISNSIAFLMDGYDTLSSFLSYFVYAMATNLDVQRNVRNEIALHIGQGEVTYEKLKGLQYLDMCMDETLRMYPPALRLDRKCNKSVKIGPYHVTEGMSVSIPVYALHHDPEYWDDPFAFKPERFTPEERAARHPYVYLPFGVGPRNCIGMMLAQLEAKATIVTLLSQFEVRTCSDTPEPPLKFGNYFGLLSSEKPIVLTFNRTVSIANQSCVR